MQIEHQCGRTIFGTLSSTLVVEHLLKLDCRYVNLPKTYAVILRDLYKTLFNIQHRKRSEAESSVMVQSVLEKLERGGHDDSQLTRTEREFLADLSDKRQRLTVLELRVLQSVFVLKELGGMDVD